MRYKQIAIYLMIVWLLGWLAACPAPILLPESFCDSGPCVNNEPFQERGSLADETTQEVALYESPPTDAGADDVGVPDVSHFDTGISDIATPADAGSGEASPSEIQRPEPGPVEKPATEKPPADRGSDCIDNDKDGVCANLLYKGYQVDCDDDDPRVSPRQTGYFATPRKNGSWDYDCSGAVERQYPVFRCITAKGACSVNTPGFVTAALCGATQPWVAGCTVTLSICVPRAPRPALQRCR